MFVCIYKLCTHTCICHQFHFSGKPWLKETESSKDSPQKSGALVLLHVAMLSSRGSLGLPHNMAVSGGQANYMATKK